MGGHLLMGTTSDKNVGYSANILLIFLKINNSFL